MKRRFNIIRCYVQELGLFTFLSYLWQRYILNRKNIRIAIEGLPEPVFIRNQSSDIALFTQIFIRKEYGDPVNKKVEQVIDCGANIGLASLYFLKQYPAVQITCIEPDPENFRILELNTEKYKNIQCIRKAVWNNQQKLTIAGRSRGSAGLMIIETMENEETEAEGIELCSLIQDPDKIDILKIDIEGSEKQVLLEGDTRWIKNVQTMFVELHEDIYPGITEKVCEKFSNFFIIRKSGEYHVFESKK